MSPSGSALRARLIKHPIPKDWSIVRLGDIGKSFIGLTYSPEDVVREKGTLVLRSSNIKGSSIAYGDNVYVNKSVPDRMRTKVGDILVCARNGSRPLIGKCALIDDSSAGHAFGAFMSVYRSEYSHYLFHLFQTDLYRRQIDRNLGATINQVTTKDICSFVFPLPPKAEQKRIVDCLNAWDSAIRQRSQLIEAKLKLKKALTQQLLTGKQRFLGFGKNKQRTAGRFIDYPNDWGYPQIKEIAREVAERNAGGHDRLVLSCSKYHGLVNSQEYFDKQVYSDDTSNYKVVRRGEFAYPANHVEEGSIGLLEHAEIGMVSPIYIVFKTDAKKVHAPFLYSLFKSEIYRHTFSVATNASVDRRGSLRWKEFSKIRVPLPSLAEQNRLSGVFESLNREIKSLESVQEALRREKCGLMQKLLTGQIRMKEAHNGRV